MEEELKKLMGDSYKENMTSEEIQNFFKNQVLGTGFYVNKEAAEAEKRKLQNELDAKNLELQNRMTDSEKKAAADKALQEQIEALQKELLAGKINSSEYKAMGITAKSRLNAGIADDDKDFTEFIKAISNEDEERTSKISKYINTLVEKAYEKGKADITKTKLGQMGNLKSSGNDDGEISASEERAKNLAEKMNSSQSKNYYFK